MKTTSEKALREFIFYRKHGKIHIKEYIGQGGSVEIPQFIDEYPVTKICNNAFKKSEVTDVIIPDGVRIIGTFAFWNCKKLRKVTLHGRIDECKRAFIDSAVEEINGIEFLVGSGDSLSSSFCRTPFYENNETLIIGDRLVWCRDNSKIIRIPEYIKRIGCSAFHNSNAEKIILPEKLEEIGSNAFGGSSIVEIHIPDSVRKFGTNVLDCCSQLEKIRLPKDFGSRAQWSGYLGVPKLQNIYLINDTQLFPHSDDDVLIYDNVSCIINYHSYLYHPVRLRERQIFPERLEYLKLAKVLADARVNVFRNDTFIVENSEDVFGVCMWHAVNSGRRFTIIFDFDNVYAEVLFWFPFVPYCNLEQIYKSRLPEFYEKCLVNADDGRFLDFNIYDGHILEQDIPFRIKAQIAYKRIKSRYRLTNEAMENFIHYFCLHRKKLYSFLDKMQNDDMKKLFYNLLKYND